jgi:hypothetical protein
MHGVPGIVGPCTVPDEASKAAISFCMPVAGEKNIQKTG